MLYNDILPLLENFNAESPIWVFPTIKNFSTQEQSTIKESFQNLQIEWTSHSNSINSTMAIAYDSFLIIVAEEKETQQQISGCSKDKLFAWIKHTEQKLALSLTDRNFLSFLKNDTLQHYKLIDIDSLIQQGNINKDTLFFNNAIHSVQQFKDAWIISVKESWLYQRYFIENIKS